jgi:hypothetical protein
MPIVPVRPVARTAEGGSIVKKHNFFIFYLQTLTPLFQTLISCLPSSQRHMEVDLAGLPTLDQSRMLLP